MSRATDSYSSEKEFRGSMARSNILRFLPMILLPVLILGFITVNRTRSLLQEQLKNQITQVGQEQKEQYQALVAEKATFLANLEQDAKFVTLLDEILTANANNLDDTTSRENFFHYFEEELGKSPTYFDDFIVVAADSSILLSSKPIWEGARMSPDSYKPLFEKPASIALYNTHPFYYGFTYITKLRVFTSQPHLTPAGERLYLIGLSDEDEFLPVLYQGSIAFHSARAYIITNPATDNAYLGIAPKENSQTSANTVQLLGPYPEFSQTLTPLLQGTNAAGVVEFESPIAGELVVAHYTWVPELEIGIVIEVPKEDILAPIRGSGTTIIAFFIVASIVLGIMIFISTNANVKPIQEITRTAQHFAQGDLQRRAIVNRNDEIGLLAYSFNQVANELSLLYRSLETTVDIRTQQIRTASEVAHIATSATNIDQVLQKTVDLIVERFEQYQAAIYLIDSTRQWISLRAASGESSESSTFQNFQIEVGSQSIIAKVATNRQPWVSNDVSIDPYYMAIEAVPDTRSEAAFPLQIGDNLLGVLDIQSGELNAYSENEIVTFQILANQISSSIQNFRLLETTQIDLQATSLLYQVSRSITEAETNEDVFLALKNTIQAMPYAALILVSEANELRSILMTDRLGNKIDGVVENISISYSELNENIPDAYPSPVTARDLGQYPEPLAKLLKQQNYNSLTLYPVRVEDRILGLVFIADSASEKIDSAILETLTSLFDMSRTALEKINALQITTQRLAEIQTLNTVSQSIVSEIKLTNLYEIFHEQINQVMGNVNFLIALYDSETKTIEVPYMDEGDGEIVSIPAFPLGQGLTSIIINTRQPLMIVEDTVNRSRALGAIVTSERPAKSWMGVPLSVGGDIIGAIVLQDLEQEFRFDQDDLRLLSTLAAQIAIAIRNVRLIESSREKAERDSRLLEITSKIRQAADMQSILQITTQELSKAFDARRALIEIGIDPANAVELTRINPKEAEQ